MARKILLIDDEPHLAELMAVRLKTNGYEVVTATSGREGLAKATQEKPDLILLDILMPDVDGYQALRHLKEDEETKNIPVMMLTVKRWSEDIKKAMAGGARDYIVKPFEPKMLLEKIREVLKNA